jgi:hypothetical protein
MSTHHLEQLHAAYYLCALLMTALVSTSLARARVCALPLLFQTSDRSYNMYVAAAITS